MNMISTGAFLTEADISNKQETVAEKFARVWEKKNAKVARAGGVSLMALSLAACGSEDDTAVVEPTEPTTPVEPTEPTTPVEPTPTVNTITKALLDFASGDTLAGTDGDDVLNLEINTSLANTTTITDIETINVTAYGAQSISMKLMTGVEKITGSGSTGKITLNDIADPTIKIGLEGTNTGGIEANYKTGVLAGSSDTLSVELLGAKAVALDVDAGFEDMTIDTGSADTAAVAGSSLTTLTVPGVTKVDITGAGDLTLNSTFSNFTTIDASAMTGGIVGKTISSTTGLSTEGFSGASAGTTIKLGSANDNIKFADNTAASKTNTIKLGDGNDTLDITTGGAGANYVFGEAGNDVINATTLASTDVVDGGAGNDTLKVSGTNVALMRGIETVTVDAGAADASFTVSSSDVAQDITVSVDATADVDATLATLAAGSTVTIADSTSVANGTIGALTVGYGATEAAATIDINAAVADSADATLTVSEVTDLTLDFAKAATLTGGDLAIADTTALTINAAKAVDLVGGILNGASDKLKTITVTGSDAVDLGAITNSDKLETITMTTAKKATIGDIIDSKLLDTVTVTSSKDIDMGAIGSNTAADDITAITLSAATGVAMTTVAAKSMGDVSITNSSTGGVSFSKIGAANTNTGVMGDVTITTAEGNIATVDGITSDLTMGTVTLEATAGSITADDTTDSVTDENPLVAAAVAGGLTVNLTAKTAIAGQGAGTADEIALVSNSSDIMATLAGTAAATINYTSAGSSNDGQVNLTATNTGGLNTTITNDGTAGEGETSTINLGNAISTAQNDVTMSGIVDTLNVNGGSGKDNLDFASATNSIKVMNINLGTGTDSVDFTNYTPVGDNKAAYDGLVINLSSSDVTFDAGTATAASVASGKAVGYDDDAVSTKTNTDAKGVDITITNVESVTGTANADYIVANSTGTTIKGGAGADTLVGGAGADTFVFAATDSSDTVTDTVSGFVGGTDEISFAAADNYSDLSATDFSGSADLDAAATAAIVAENVTNAVDGEVDAILFEYGGSSYFLVQTDGDDVAYDATTDLLIEVSGLTGTVAVGDFVA